MSAEQPTAEEKDRARKSKKSIMTILERLDLFSKFKVIAQIQGKKLVSALREAIVLYIEKYSE